MYEVLHAIDSDNRPTKYPRLFPFCKRENGVRKFEVCRNKYVLFYQNNGDNCDTPYVINLNCN